MTSKMKWVLAGLGLVGLIALAFSYAPPAKAADKAGVSTGYGDLEERIADLEATTARKGNRKVSLTFSGQMNKAMYAWDSDGFSDQAVIDNPASESYFDVTGEAVVRPGWKVGYKLSIGQGKTGLLVDALSSSVAFGTDNDIYTRESYVFGTTPFGKVSLGLISMATDDFTSPSVANTDASTKRLTIPLNSVIVKLGGATILNVELEPFNGEKADGVKYEISQAGFTASAAWSNDDTWDAALTYSGDFQTLKLMAGVGYAKDKKDDIFGLNLLPVESETLIVNAGVKHVPSGIFFQGSYGSLEIGNTKTDAYHVQGGIEQRWIAAGETTIFGEYAEWQDLDMTFYGLGVNQRAADWVDLYLNARHYEVFDEDVNTFMAGARVKF
jgi:hypothetical protein